MMNYYITLTGDLYTRTYYSFGPLGSTKVTNKGFMRLTNGNITVDVNTPVTRARCVRVIRVE